MADFLLQPWQLYLVILAGWVNRQQQALIEYLIMDRDTKFCNSFRSSLEREGIKPVVLPSRSPNLNSHLERFFGSLRRECLNRMIFFGQRSLTNAVNHDLQHDHSERDHQGLSNSIIEACEGLAPIRVTSR